jgi:transposase
VNVLKPYLRTTVETLLRRGLSHRQIAAQTGVNRRTIAKIDSKCTALATGSATLSLENAPPRPPTLPSACEPHRAWIEEQVKLGRNATAIYQDLVDDRGFQNKYNSVKRFVHRLVKVDPARFDVLEFAPGEESQVDYGLGAPTRRPGSDVYRRPRLFVLTLRYSHKAFRKVVWKSSKLVWAQLHVEAWRAFGGSTRYVVLDNLKEGVLEPNIYEPRINSVYAEMLKHHGVVADPCRVRDPNRKGSVENAIRHTQSTALQGRRFESIEEQNEHLAHWEERWAATRIHGRDKRQVLEMFDEERPHLQPLPVEPFRPFEEVVRRVDDMGLITIGNASYAALPAHVRSEIKVRIYERDIEILAADGSVARRHEKSGKKGSISIDDSERLFNPSREAQKLLERVSRVGMHAKELAEKYLSSGDRPGLRQLYGLANLLKRFTAIEVEAAAKEALHMESPTYRYVKELLARKRAQSPIDPPALVQAGEEIREVEEYAQFFDQASQRRRKTK